MNDALTMVELIEKKKRGAELADDQISWLCEHFVSGGIGDHQMAAWLMAVCWRGLSDAETLALTRAMLATGATLDWSGVGRAVVDKHSTGGVGDNTSLVLVPLMAAAGFAFVKMAGRALGRTGGTLDKLESIPGFQVELSTDRIREQVERIGCAIVGQSPQLVPADGKMYALRDVTGTVDSLPLIASSIMSKKLAAGAPVMVLDVKFGSGAFMQTVEEGRALARAMVAIGAGAGRRVRAVLSPMAQPLGCAVGNALEVREAIETLHGDGPSDLWDLTVELGTQLIVMTDAETERASARARLEELRLSGAAARAFAALIEAQGGDARVVDEPDRLPAASHVLELKMSGSAKRWVRGVSARKVAEAALELGGSPAVGIVLRARTGEAASPGDVLAEIHADDTASAARAEARLRDAYRLSEEPTPHPTGDYEVITRWTR
ncbi:MAG TPA: thymidine phosphorylase [Longimicrobiaceae bacterium]|nr:thymidine phosphorylase [Longimicrobiaceae bacterium]